MPLFFILSCVTFEPSRDNDQLVRKTEKAFRHLIVPAVILFLLRNLMFVAKEFLFNGIGSFSWKSYLIEQINVFYFGSGVQVDVMETSVPAIGIVWFFFVLFEGRFLFDYLHLRLPGKWFEAVLMICTLAGVAFGELQWLPFSLDVALAVMPFFYAGYRLKGLNAERRPLLWGGTAFGIWAATLILCYSIRHSYLELACRRYPLFPLCYVGAVAATVFVCYFCAAADKMRATRPLRYLGKNSMYMLWVHILDNAFYFIWDRTGNNWIRAGLRVATDIVLFVLLMYFIGLIRKKIDGRRALASGQ